MLAGSHVILLRFCDMLLTTAKLLQDEGSVQSAAENATAVQAVLAAVDPIRRQLYNYSKPSETEDDMPEAVKT